MRPALAAAALVLSALAAAIAVSAAPVREEPWSLVVSAPHDSAVGFRTPVVPGDSFCLTYVHSVSKSVVSGSFRITQDGGLEPVSTVFRSFGPGLPWTPDADYELLEDGSILVRHHEPAREDIRLWVSPLTRERLSVNDHEIDLTGGAEGETLIEIRVRK